MWTGLKVWCFYFCIICVFTFYYFLSDVIYVVQIGWFVEYRVLLFYTCCQFGNMYNKILFDLYICVSFTTTRGQPDTYVVKCFSVMDAFMSLIWACAADVSVPRWAWLGKGVSCCTAWSTWVHLMPSLWGLDGLNSGLGNHRFSHCFPSRLHPTLEREKAAARVSVVWCRGTRFWGTATRLGTKGSMMDAYF